MKKLFLCLVLVLAAAAAFAGNMSQSEYYNKVRGCWTGKCIGGALGMPREGAFWKDQVKEFPEFSGYLSDVKCGWSFYRGHTAVPDDGEWHTVTISCALPGFREDTTVPTPIIGISPEAYSRPVHIHVKNIRIKSHDIKVTDDDFGAFAHCAKAD
ncbi:MAG: hypothetical protein ILO36_09190, partial [Abditibacteriota bacterium]|nr:hypothetical protein [Abditibacteriota bacterium]